MMRCSRYGGRLSRTWMPTNSHVAVAIRDRANANPDLIPLYTSRETEVGENKNGGRTGKSEMFSPQAVTPPFSQSRVGTELTDRGQFSARRKIRRNERMGRIDERTHCLMGARVFKLA